MIVCMSRRICIDLYNETCSAAPEWHNPNDDEGVLKVIMTGSASDPVEWQPHIRNKPRREELAKRFKDAERPVQARDRSRHVADRVRRAVPAHDVRRQADARPRADAGHRARQPRVQGQARRAGRRLPRARPRTEAGARHLHRERRQGPDGHRPGRSRRADAGEVRDLRRRSSTDSTDSSWTKGSATQKLAVLPAAQEHVLKQNDGKNRFVKAVEDLSKAFALAVPADEVLAVVDDVAFFQAIKSVLTKNIGEGKRDPSDIDHAIRQIVSRAVSSDEVIDIFAAAGLKKPDISVLSDEFLAEVRDLPQRNLAVEMLRKLLTGEIKQRAKKNVVQARSFLEMLEKSITRYQNRAIETAAVIEELIGLAREMREAQKRGEQLGLSDDEIAFYDALGSQRQRGEGVSATQLLKMIAQELVKAVRNNLTIDWTVRENVRANLRVIIKRILRKYGYPPDKQEKATQTVLEQAEALSRQCMEGNS